MTPHPAHSHTAAAPAAATAAQAGCYLPRVLCGRCRRVLAVHVDGAPLGGDQRAHCLCQVTHQGGGRHEPEGQGAPSMVKR